MYIAFRLWGVVDQNASKVKKPNRKSMRKSQALGTGTESHGAQSAVDRPMDRPGAQTRSAAAR